jgi:hypothetical protein
MMLYPINSWRELSLILPHVNLDGDDYFWIEKFTKQREPKGRVLLLKEDLSNYKQWILSGAVCGWGDDDIIPGGSKYEQSKNNIQYKFTRIRGK